MVAPPARWRARAAIGAEAATLVLALGALGLWCTMPDTARLAGHNPGSTAFIDLRRDQAAAASKSFTLRWQWRSFDSISRYLRAAVIYAEDYNFYRHDGVDWDALEHAVKADWNKGAMAIGGSTITQQLAKNLYLSPSRSIVRKLREALIAFSLEDHLSKRRILEIYLNVVEWGDGVFGAEAAARAWFHGSAHSLTPAQAVRLAVALPNPIARAPNVRGADLTRKSVRLLRLLRMQGLINASQERIALDEVGAPGERVLPDREAAAPTALSSEPPAPRDEPSSAHDDRSREDATASPADPAPRPPEPPTGTEPPTDTEPPTGTEHPPGATGSPPAGTEPPPTLPPSTEPSSP